MSLYRDKEYTNRLGYRLDLLSWNVDVANFRCPVCGDSKKSTTKKRGFLFPSECRSSLLYKCHNCGIAESFSNFLNRIDPVLHKEYVMDIFSSRRDEKPKKTKSKSKPTVQASLFDSKPFKEELDTLHPVLELNKSHEIRKYLDNRKIPKAQQKKLFYTDNTKETGIEFLVAGRVNDYEERTQKLDTGQRIVIAGYDTNGRMNTTSMRSLNHKVRYFSLVRTGCDKVIGKYDLNVDDDVLVCEGGLDSLFLYNCAATQDFSLLKFDADIYIFDNEPFNKEVNCYVKKTIKKNKRVVMWDKLPAKFKKSKDINQMIIDGMSIRDINMYVRDNAVSGMISEMRFGDWRKR